jgi:ribose transport system permease protein
MTYAELQILLAAAVLAIVFAVLYPDSFATTGTGLNMARVAGILLVVAIAQSFALIVGGFDISVGATMGLTSVVAATLMVGGVGIGWAILAGILTGSAVGLVNGIGIAVFRVTPFVMTLGMLTAARGLADLIANGGTIVGLPREFALFGRSAWYGVPSAACIGAIVLVLAWIVLQRTRAGLYIYSIGGSLETARVAGVPIVRYQVLAYTLCGALAAVAGLMLTSRVSVSQGSLGQGYELLSVATAVIGVVLGVALITVLTTGLDIAGVNPFVQQMVTGSVLVLAVLISNFRSGRIPFLRKPGRTSGG